MTQSIKIKFSFFFLLICATISLPSFVFSSTQGKSNWLNEPISISFQDEPLSNVLKKLSQQTGVSIAYDKELANEKITGNYQNIKTPDVITRLFRSKNKSIQINKEKKIIIVKTFGAKSFIWASTMQGQNNSSRVTLAELEKIHAQQYNEYKDRIASDAELFEDGMTRGELRAIHEKQYQGYQTLVADDKAIFEGSITRGELKAMHAEQYAKYQASIANENEKLDGNITRGALNKLHEEQYKTYKQRTSNANEVLEIGITRRELDEMHKMQHADFKARNN